MTQAFRDHEIRLMNPPNTDAPDEPCDRCYSDLGNTAYKVRGEGKFAGYTLLLCEDCAVPQERCDQCGFWRCRCRD